MTTVIIALPEAEIRLLTGVTPNALLVARTTSSHEFYPSLILIVKDQKGTGTSKIVATASAMDCSSSIDLSGRLDKSLEFARSVAHTLRVPFVGQVWR